MASPLNSIETVSVETVFDIVPIGYISSIKNRINVQELSKEKIQELMKTANVFEQEVMLQDLLIAGRKMETMQQRNMTALAAELYIEAPKETQKDFLMHLIGANSIFKNFSSAMLANFIFHESIELKEKGSSGLTVNQLQEEKTLAIGLQKFKK